MKKPRRTGVGKNCHSIRTAEVAVEGFEQPHSNAEETDISDSGDVNSDDIPADLAKLADILQALAALSESERQALRTLLGDQSAG